jgi:hypothetical protein
VAGFALANSRDDNRSGKTENRLAGASAIAAIAPR